MVERNDRTPPLAGSIAAQHGFPSQRRLLIYHHAYRARLVDALRDSFGHTATYLGMEWFDADVPLHMPHALH